MTEAHVAHPGPRRRRLLAQVTPVLLAALAGALIYVDLAVENAVNDLSITLHLPLVLGVFISPSDAQALQSLVRATNPGNDVPWQVQVRADPTGRAEASVELSFGQLAPNEAGRTPIGFSEPEFAGSLPRPVNFVFMLPYGTTYNTDNVLSTRTDACAQWKVGQKSESVMPIVLRDPEWPDIAVCRIPSITSFQFMQIAFDVSVPAAGLRESFAGQSSVAVSNPSALDVTQSQDNGSLPRGLLYTAGQAYQLYVQPADHESFSGTVPQPSGAGLETSQWDVQPGGFVSAAMTDAGRRNEIDIVQQVLLLLAGMLFGLIPAAVPFAAKARREGRQRRVDTSVSSHGARRGARR